MSCRKRGRDENADERMSFAGVVPRITGMLVRMRLTGLALASTSTTAIAEAVA